MNADFFTKHGLPAPVLEYKMKIENILKLVSYNRETGVFTWKTTTGKAVAGRVAGSKQMTGYITIGICGNRFLAHRLAWFLENGSWPRDQIDHINGVRTDNRISNLRSVAQSDNNKNAGLRRDNALGKKGVRFVSNRYRADIRCNGKRYYLGRFRTLRAAVAEYNLKAKSLFGEFARKEIAA